MVLASDKHCRNVVVGKRCNVGVGFQCERAQREELKKELGRRHHV